MRDNLAPATLLFGIKEPAKYRVVNQLNIALAARQDSTQEL